MSALAHEIRLLTHGKLSSCPCKKNRFLSGSWLKLIAVVTMVIDHIASVFLKKDQTVFLRLFGRMLTRYEAMRMIGRVSFPLFAFLLVEGFVHTRNRRKYGTRLLVLAVISEIPWNLEHTGTLFCTSQNVIFTLLLGFLGLCLIEGMKDAEGRLRKVIALIGLFLLSCVLRADYGCSGFCFILLMGVLRRYPVYRGVIGAGFLSSTWKAGMAFVPIAFYNGKRGFIRGKVMQVLFYLIYPVHFRYCTGLGAGYNRRD